MPAINKYSKKCNTNILVALLKHHNIRRVIASPGSTNISFVRAVQNDPFFKVYSSVDERSAAYMACGMAAQSGEPVVLSCTGATASRNYMSGLTEAFYRKLPILAVTSSQHLGHIGHMYPQMLDRTTEPNDICKYSVQCPLVQSDEDLWACETSINQALIYLQDTNPGPVHINLVTDEFSEDNANAVRPKIQFIDYVKAGDDLPSLKQKRIAIFVGSHLAWPDSLVSSVEEFCKKYNAVVLGDHTSNYPGKYWIDSSLVLQQAYYRTNLAKVDVMIHIGEISGAYISLDAEEVWRVSPDGAVRDPFKKLRYIFDMEEEFFFHAYDSLKSTAGTDESYYNAWKEETVSVHSLIPELPFSNAWCAQHTVDKLPKRSILHLGILNSLRCWNYFPIDSTIRCYCNTGGFGIDGCMSSLIGASLVEPNKLFFGVVGDLACFYDLNSLGNRYVGPNIRIMVINNGIGAEFKNYSHIAAKFGDSANPFIAAAGHYGNQSRTLLKHFTEDLGFTYLSAENKEEFIENIYLFTDENVANKPIIFEVFTDYHEESDALKAIQSIMVDRKSRVKGIAKKVIGQKGIDFVKKVL